MKFNWNYPTAVWVGENRINDLEEACKNLDINNPVPWINLGKVYGQKGKISEAIRHFHLQLVHNGGFLFPVTKSDCYLCRYEKIEN